MLINTSAPRSSLPLPPPPCSPVGAPAAVAAAAVTHHAQRGAPILPLPLPTELPSTLLPSPALSADGILPHLRHLRISLQPANRCGEGPQGGGEEGGEEAGEQLQRGLLHHGRR